VKTEAQDEARRMRLEGASIKEIERVLGVSRSSVSRWVRDVELEAAQRARLVERVRLGPVVAGERKAAKAHETRRGYQEEGRHLVYVRDSAYTAGCMLYWAEGAKLRNTVKLTNSDPGLLSYFVEFLRRHFGVSDARFRVACNLFADHLERQEEIERFWLERLGLDQRSLRKSTVNTYSKYSQKKRTNKLPYGTTAFIVHDTRIVQTIFGSIQELGGFDRPEWLD
jgi:DNA-binding transcriptional regulator YdaS (Cro superfamily)